MTKIKILPNGVQGHQVIGCYGVKKGCSYPDCDCEMPTHPEATAIEESVEAKADKFAIYYEDKRDKQIATNAYAVGYQQRNKEIVKLIEDEIETLTKFETAAKNSISRTNYRYGRKLLTTLLYTINKK